MLHNGFSNFFLINWLIFFFKSKTKLKLAMSRIKLQKNKKDNLAKNGKREVADLLKSGKEGDARVKVILLFFNKIKEN